MLSVEQALAMVLENIDRLDAEKVVLWEALGRVLAEGIIVTQDLPPFANSSMDGYAVIASDIANASRENPITLEVVDDIPAGKFPNFTLGHGQAARIMTGAPVPLGANAIVPVEETNDERRGKTPPPTITIFKATYKGDYIRAVGEDVRKGDVILPLGRVLRAADMGVLAGLGITYVSVVRRPRVAILSTGDELLSPDQPLQPGKIHDMNSYTLYALVGEYGGEPMPLGIARDTEEAVTVLLHQAVEAEADIILSSAGVSVGAFDVVKTVLDRLGAVNFWKVNMRPGKPLTFGHVQSIPFLGLPGNPVSSMVSFEVFVRPLIFKMLGLEWEMDTEVAIVGEPLDSDGRLTFARVRLEDKNGEWVAYMTGTQSSGAISSMVKADALLIIPEGVTHVEAGQRLEVRRF